MIFPKLKIRNLNIEYPYFLAPLAGVSDSPFRRIANKWGAPITFTEMTSVRGITYSSVSTQKIIHLHPSEKNVGVQLFGAEPEDFRDAVNKIDFSQFVWVDINMGCPVKKVVKTFSGAYLMQYPSKIYAIVKEVRKVIDIPLSVKIRLGWDNTNSPKTLEIANAAIDAGIDAIIVHGRYKNNSYNTPADYHKIGELKSKIDVPVIGNGDIFSYQDLIRLREISNCDGAMIARGALGKPWIFSGLNSEVPYDFVPNKETWFNSIKEHLDYVKEWEGDSNRVWKMMRKHLLWYARGFIGSKEIRKKITSVDNYNNIIEILKEASNI